MKPKMLGKLCHSAAAWDRNMREAGSPRPAPCSARSTHHEASLNEPQQLPLELPSKRRVVQQHTRLDVSLLAARGEVCAGYECAFGVHRHALCVDAAKLGAPAGS